MVGRQTILQRQKMMMVQMLRWPKNVENHLKNVMYGISTVRKTKYLNAMNGRMSITDTWTNLPTKGWLHIPEQTDSDWTELQEFYEIDMMRQLFRAIGKKLHDT